MPTSNTPTQNHMNFQQLTLFALQCRDQWRAWAKREPAGSAQARHAHHLASLFEKQAEVLSAMHRNRTELAAPARSDFKRPTR